ncbi:archaetidylinositol phosphate synthase [Pyrofollis japonicus]|uniref:CDP-alcohol phosphatidyltransferase family protein n=1 Tax=Pyrofollis japonicus TaxID=3060460 RepID=UPI00295A6664|nr:CDP-alcohol phosphatidyltransferase family protein [Pyrofollis japonicus]BEP17469.1 archaetidylinositol phosphate synthase [Pyrofollis japonicus]
MLTRLRSKVSGILTVLAGKLAVLPADFYTVIGLIGAILFLLSVSLGPLVAAVFLALSGILDALDGAVARLRGEAGPKGAFLDSMLDRIADTFYALGFYMLGYPAEAVILFLSAALITSYARARYEALVGQSMEGVGLLERADRLVAQIIVLLVQAAIGGHVAAILYWLLVVLAWITVAQRLAVGYKALPRRKRDT